MKNPFITIVGVFVLTVMSGQTYLIYSIEQHLDQLTANLPGDSLRPDAADEIYFEDHSLEPENKPSVYKMKLNGLSASATISRRI